MNVPHQTIALFSQIEKLVHRPLSIIFSLFYSNDTHINRAYFRHWGHGCNFLGHIFWKKGILFLATPKQKSFLTVFNENIFSKTQGVRLGAKIEPYKGLE